MTFTPVCPGTVVYAHRKRTAKKSSMELMVTVMLHKMDDKAGGSLSGKKVASRVWNEAKIKSYA